MEPTIIHNTFVIERNYPATPERVFAALSDPARKRRWFADGENHSVEQFDMDFREGGTENTLSRFGAGSPFPGVTMLSSGIYQDIVPNRRIVSSSTMTISDRRISAALATFELIPAENGTDLVFTHQAVFFEFSDGPERREQGWRKLLEKLAKEVSE